jgi:hypothetical protein
LDIHFTVGTSCERAASLAEKNAAARHHVLRSLISLYYEHRVYSENSKYAFNIPAKPVLIVQKLKGCKRRFILNLDF